MEDLSGTEASAGMPVDDSERLDEEGGVRPNDCSVAVVCHDRRRLLMDVSQAISESSDDVSIVEVHTQSHRGGLATMNFRLDGAPQAIPLVLAALKRVDGVQEAFEVKC